MASDFEWVYNTLTLGGTSEYGLLSVDGIGSPGARFSDTEKMGDHGSFIFAEFLKARTVTMHGDIASTTLETRVNALRAAFTPRVGALPLVYKLPGDIQKRIYCKPTRLDIPMTPEYGIGYTEFHVELMAEDPRIYDDTEGSQTIASGATQAISNAGVIPTWPTITIPGPGVTNPTIKNTTTNKQFKINTTVGAAQTLTLDFLNRTAKIGTSSVYGSIDATSIWWDLIAGSNSIQYVSGGGTLTIKWRSAWH
jgi:phage-related protein